jgi:glycosyltransferase involved in cell wall biosynthesis
MKLLIVTHNISAGGAATACRRLIAAFKGQGIEVKLLSVKERSTPNLLVRLAHQVYCGLLSRLDREICKLLSNRSTHWQSSGLIGVLKARQIKTLNPTAVNVHWIGHATMSLRQLEKLEIPIVITMHDEWWLEEIAHYSSIDQIIPRSRLAKIILSKLIRRKKKFLLRENVQIVCLSNEMKEKFERFLPRQHHKIHVIPNPVNSDQFHPISTVKRDSPKLLFAGSASDPRKGFDLLEKILNQMNETCLIIVPGVVVDSVYGVGRQIRINAIPKVTSEAEMNKLYNQSDMCIVPSKQEALPQVATEALMAGTPVASFEVGGLIDIVQNGINGYLIPKFDTQKMAETLDRFLRFNNFNREHISIDAKGRFSEKSVVKCYMTILQDQTNF